VRGKIKNDLLEEKFFASRETNCKTLPLKISLYFFIQVMYQMRAFYSEILEIKNIVCVFFPLGLLLYVI